ncbi:unnamed protein product [Gongylonema pulchrum]|uniref:AsnC_trans_reg domain-containing protein n=1 Tax=Gongylonema pulchrum TaxID=637853 RepID=A0A183D3E8_9BILA|nr:unnamed protein product [Gongylonema pulchrum]
MIRCRATGQVQAQNITTLVDVCSTEVFLTVVVGGWLKLHLRKLNAATRESVLECVLSRISTLKSAAAHLDAVELIATAGFLDSHAVVQYVQERFGEFTVLDSIIVIFLRTYQRAECGP